MTSSAFALCLTCLLLGKMAQTTDQKSSSVRQESGFVSVKTGDQLTLRCSYKSNVVPKLSWYKQTLGQKPRLISTFFKYNLVETFHNEFKNNSRFTLDTENGKNHLTITDLRISDSATYYCIKTVQTIEFLESTIVNVNGSGLDVPALVHQSSSETAQPGGSVTLNCTVHTGTCDGKHSVYWFRSSEDSHPGLIYTHGGRDDQCKRKSNTETHSCVYNLSMKSLNLSHAGTYYCAVVSCGHIVFGQGTKLDFEDGVNCCDSLVYFLGGGLAFTTLLAVLLAFTVHKMSKRNGSQSKEPQARTPAPPTADAEVNEDAANLHYAALSVNLPSRSRRQRNNTNNECVYSTVKH